MRILNLMSRLLGKTRFSKYILLGILSGLLSFLFINLITRSLSLIVEGRLNSMISEYMIIFAFIITLFMWTWRALSVGIINLSQRLFWNLRKQILASVIKASHQQFTSRKSQIHSSVVSDVNVLTNASMSIISFCTASILSVSCLIYLLSISMPLFLVSFITVVVGVVIYRYGSKNNVLHFDQAREFEDQFLESFNDLMDGFKEIYMEPKKGRDIYENKINPIASQAFQYNNRAYIGFLNNQVTGQILFYCLIASVLLLFSVVFKVRAEDTISFVFTLLYLLTSVETIMVLLPHIVRARVATNRILDLFEDLENAQFSNGIVPKNYVGLDGFKSLEICDLEFQYPNQSFAIGPVNLKIEQGDIVFIYGSNGSGKTTLVNAILGLCLPSSGAIKFNGAPVINDNYDYYRTSFAVVFSNFYLFRELLGIDEVNHDRWNKYLELFEIQDKVSLNGKSFSTTELSMGQRKRLALIAMLLEDKPVIVMDEWAADQDPYFRKKFYTDILPFLKKEGRTIIAITHDDRYYHCADRLFKMEDGKLHQEIINENLQPILYK